MREKKWKTCYTFGKHRWKQILKFLNLLGGAHGTVQRKLSPNTMDAKKVERALFVCFEQLWQKRRESSICQIFHSPMRLIKMKFLILIAHTEISMFRPELR